MTSASRDNTNSADGVALDQSSTGPLSWLDSPVRHLALQALIIGFVVWGVVYLLRVAIHNLFNYVVYLVDLTHMPFLIFIPLVFGALVGASIIWRNHTFIHFRTPTGQIHPLIDAESDGLERAIALYYSSEPSLEESLLGRDGVDVRWEIPTVSLALRKWGATLATLGFGGSGGLEGSVALIGESLAASVLKPRSASTRGLGTRFWNWWRVTNRDELQTLQICGMAAAFSTLLGAPFASAFFAVEVVYRRRPVLDKFFYALVASISAYFLSHWASPLHTQLFTFHEVNAPPFTLQYLMALLSVFLGVVGIKYLFAKSRLAMSEWSHRTIPNIWMRHTFGALLTGIVAMAAFYLGGDSVDLVLSTGQHVVDQALSGNLLLQAATVALFGKLLTTTFTVGTGGSAGLLIPAIYMGTMVGYIVAQLAGFDPVQLIGPAVAASMVSMINVPFAAILLTMELFGRSYILPALLALIVIMLMGQEVSIYRTQREEQRSREILPGYEVRRIPVPPMWVGATLLSIQLRSRFNLNAIGMVEQVNGAGRIHPNIEVRRKLKDDDIIIVIGRKEDFDVLELAFVEASTPTVEQELPE